MKTLSIKQPWASLIALGIKDIENRTWKTSYRGKIYIHASAKSVKELHLTNEQNQKYKDVYFHHHKSAIIGEVEIVDCVINHPSIWAEKTEEIGTTIDNEKMYRGDVIYNWVLANPILYDEPILNLKGKLSFWEFEKPENF